MKINVRVKPSSRRRGVQEKDGVLIVHVKAPPIEGRANRELLEVLSEHFGIPKSRIRILRGGRGRNKVVEIEE